MPGWSTVARLPFRPMRAAEEMHRHLAGAHNLPALALFFFLSSCIFALYSAHLVWLRIPEGTFLAGLGILAAAIVVSTFVYVVGADMISDAGRGLRRIFPLLLSTLAISGLFSLLGSVVYEAGVLGLWKVRRAVAVALAGIALWQVAVEAVNLKRLYDLSWWRAILGEVVARAIATSMSLGFIGFMSGVTRPWKHWRAILWVFGLT